LEYKSLIKEFIPEKYYNMICGSGYTWLFEWITIFSFLSFFVIIKSWKIKSYNLIILYVSQRKCLRKVTSHRVSSLSSWPGQVLTMSTGLTLWSELRPHSLSRVEFETCNRFFVIPLSIRMRNWPRSMIWFGSIPMDIQCSLSHMMRSW
jgi:hypothetical protein